MRASARLLALPAARFAASVAAGVLAVALFAGAVRVLPLLLAPGVPLQIAPTLARGALGVALETALFVAPPIGWALAAARLVERGEARALFAVGVRPLRLLAGTWPSALAVAVAAGLAAAAWGREAAAPGRLVRDLLAEGREACKGAALPAAAQVPLLGVSWACLPGEPPRVVGAAPLGEIAPTPRGSSARAGPAFAAGAIEVSDDLRLIEAQDLTLVVPLHATHATDETTQGASSWATPASARVARLRAATASIRGLPPLGRASNLSVRARAALLAASAVAMATLAAALVLRGAMRSRARSLALGAAGPAAALMAFSSLERSPMPAFAYAAVPLAGLTAMAALGWLMAYSQRRT